MNATHPYKLTNASLQCGSQGARGPGNTSIRELVAEKRLIVPVLRFLRSTGVRKVEEEEVVFVTGTP